MKQAGLLIWRMRSADPRDVASQYTQEEHPNSRPERSLGSLILMIMPVRKTENVWCEGELALH